MTVTSALRLSHGNLVVNGRTILAGVPDNVVSTSSLTSHPVHGIFLGALFDHSDNRHVVSLGTLRGVRFLSCFRFKLWWMAQMMGERGRDVPFETQFLLVETRQNSDPDRIDSGELDDITYLVFLPIIDGSFRASLQGAPNDELELCIESGDEETKQVSFTHSLFITAGNDPFSAVTAAVSTVKSHLKTFRLLTEKKLPFMVDYFGWCTWDAFYQDVTQEGVDAGLASLAAGGSPAGFVIIDDGWQTVGADPDQPSEKPVPRLTDVKENHKFNMGMAAVVEQAKKKHGVKYVYVWHAIAGYWAGVSTAAMSELEVKVQYPVISKGVAENDEKVGKEAMVEQGLGLVMPKEVGRLYEKMHGYLAGSGVDGVKVDSQCVLETVGGGLGGRVELTRQYHSALEASVGKHFPDNGCIACMCHNTDGLYCSKQTAVVRASDDFFPRRPVTHTIHIAAVAYNSIFLGEYMQPDWDMFHSVHPAAYYHASARAISGGPIYVSDAPGNHDFNLLRKLVLPDGSILRPRLPGRPTLDCLFSDPSRDGVSLLKIWNMNKFTGVLGVYNCQGAAWSKVEKKNVFHELKSEVITGAVKARDVHLLAEAVVGSDWNGDCIAYRHGDENLVRLQSGATLSVSLKVIQEEIFTLTPIKVFATGIGFAPVGLVDMYNAGGAIVGMSYHTASTDIRVGGNWDGRVENRSSNAVNVIELEVKGCGKFGFYSSAKPRKCVLGSDIVELSYDSSSGLGMICLERMPDNEKKVHVLLIEV